MGDIDPAVVALVSAFLPLALAVIVRHGWSNETTALVVFVLTAVVGGMVAYLMGVRSLEGFATVIGAIYALSQTTYRGLWKPTKVAPQIEKRTG